MTTKDTLECIADTVTQIKSIVAYHLGGGEMLAEIEDALDELKNEITDDAAESQVAEKVLDDFDEEQLVEYLKDKGYTVLNFDNLIERSKLDNFLRSEIFPRYNDQKAFL